MKKNGEAEYKNNKNEFKDAETGISKHADEYNQFNLYLEIAKSK
jgi:hypothetical protein